MTERNGDWVPCHRFTITVEVDGKQAAARTVVERACDRLMESLSAAPDVSDPFVNLTINEPAARPPLPPAPHSGRTVP